MSSVHFFLICVLWAASAEKNLESYLSKHPDCEVYDAFKQREAAVLDEPAVLPSEEEEEKEEKVEESEASENVIHKCGMDGCRLASRHTGLCDVALPSRSRRCRQEAPPPYAPPRKRAAPEQLVQPVPAIEPETVELKAEPLDADSDGSSDDVPLINRLKEIKSIAKNQKETKLLNTNSDGNSGDIAAARQPLESVVPKPAKPTTFSSREAAAKAASEKQAADQTAAKIQAAAERQAKKMQRAQARQAKEEAAEEKRQQVEARRVKEEVHQPQSRLSGRQVIQLGEDTVVPKGPLTSASNSV